jgi:hypothetical protein
LSEFDPFALRPGIKFFVSGHCFYGNIPQSFASHGCEETLEMGGRDSNRGVRSDAIDEPWPHDATSRAGP